MPYDLVAVPYKPPAPKKMRMPPVNPPKMKPVEAPRPQKPEDPPGYRWKWRE